MVISCYACAIAFISIGSSVVWSYALIAWVGRSAYLQKLYVMKTSSIDAMLATKVYAIDFSIFLQNPSCESAS